jgi:hypothetical protein
MDMNFGQLGYSGGKLNSQERTGGARIKGRTEDKALL